MSKNPVWIATFGNRGRAGSNMVDDGRELEMMDTRHDGKPASINGPTVRIKYRRVNYDTALRVPQRSCQELT